MNAKFFDLKQDKQDRMVNAALKIFALNGYKHASTDDIVREAHISKGLLFHYFDSKVGVYSFIYDYTVRFYSLELSSAIDPSETSYFEILRQIQAAKMQTMKSYPYMYMFLNSCASETITEAILSIEASRSNYESNINTIMSHADQSIFKGKKNFSEYLKMLDCTLEGILETSLKDGSFNAEMNYEENIKYINLIEKCI